MRLLSVVCPVPANAQWFRKWSVLSTVEVCKYKLEMAVKKEAFISLLVSLLVAQTNSFTKKNEKTGVTDVCLVNINLQSSPSHFPFIPEVSERSLMMESQSIVDSERCQQYCDLTQGCLYWTWYRRHCDHLPCLEDPLTKVNVCYLLSSCRLSGQKCSGCSSGSRVRDLILAFIL